MTEFRIQLNIRKAVLNVRAVQLQSVLPCELGKPRVRPPAQPLLGASRRQPPEPETFKPADLRTCRATERWELCGKGKPSDSI